jgi:hypothetical protein
MASSLRRSSVKLVLPGNVNGDASARAVGDSVARNSLAITGMRKNENLLHPLKREACQPLETRVTIKFFL